VVFAVDAASFVASFVCLAAMKLPRRLELMPGRSFLEDARVGLRVIRERRWLVVTLTADAIGNLTLASYFVLGPVVVADHFGGATQWGFLLTAGAVGGLAGGALVLRWRPARPLVAAYGIMLLVPLQLAALAPPVPFAGLLIGAALVFLAIVAANTYWQTMEQQHVPREALSRVDSIAWMISLVVMPVGLVAAGPLSAAIGVRATLLGSAALSVVTLLAAVSSRSVRGCIGTINRNWSVPTTRWIGLADNTRRSSRRIAWWRASWSVPGTRRCSTSNRCRRATTSSGEPSRRA